MYMLTSILRLDTAGKSRRRRRRIGDQIAIGPRPHIPKHELVGRQLEVGLHLAVLHQRDVVAGHGLRGDAEAIGDDVDEVLRVGEDVGEAGEGRGRAAREQAAQGDDFEEMAVHGEGDRYTIQSVYLLTIKVLRRGIARLKYMQHSTHADG